MTLLQTDRQTDTRRESLANRLGEIVKASTPKFGCLMAMLPSLETTIPNWAADNISSDTLAADGIETETHCTVLYGFNLDFDSEKLVKMLSSSGAMKVKIGKLSRFECPEYDVIKFTVISQDIRDVNKKLNKEFSDEITPSQWKFNPHITVAYVKKGTNQNLNASEIEGQTVTVQQLLYSLPEKEGRKVIDLSEHTAASDPRRERLACRLGEIISAVHVKTYTEIRNGKSVTVHEHEDKRRKQDKPQVAPKRLSREEIKDKVKSAIETAKEKVGSALQKNEPHSDLSAVKEQSTPTQYKYVEPKVEGDLPHVEQLNSRTGKWEKAFTVRGGLEYAKQLVESRGGKLTVETAHQTTSQTDTPAFRAWFGNSKVVDKDGKPLVMYHGTTKDFTEFKNYEEYGGGHGEIHFFTTNKDYANVYAEDKGSKEGGNIIPVYLRSEKLFDTTNPAHMALVKKSFRADGMEPWEQKAYIEDYFHKGLPLWDNGDMIRMAQKNGFDGIKMVERKSGIESIGVFSPNQIKSAIGNKGTWSRTDNNITATDHSVDLAEIVQAIRRERLSRRLEIIMAEEIGHPFHGNQWTRDNYGTWHEATPQQWVTDELRESLGVSRERLDNYKPEESVGKSGRHWTYKTVEGNSGGGMFDTKKEAVEAAIKHKTLKEAMHADPRSYRNIHSVRAHKWLAAQKRHYSTGMSETDANAAASKEVPELPSPMPSKTSELKPEQTKRIVSFGKAPPGGWTEADRVKASEILKCANSDTTPFTPAQTKAKNAQARQLSEAIYEAAAIAAAHKIEADKKEKRKKEIAAILLLLLLAGEDAYQKVYSTLGTDGLKNSDEIQIGEQAKTFAASRQEDLQEFAGKLRDAIGEAKAESFGMPEADAARHVREAAVKTSQAMIDVETTCTLGSIELDRLKRAGFKTAIWMTMEDERVRPSHVDCGNQGPVELGKPFVNGLKYPGDPNGALAEICGCRCWLVGHERESVSARGYYNSDSVLKAAQFEESKHPRVPSGKSEGGRFTSGTVTVERHTPSNKEFGKMLPVFIDINTTLNDKFMAKTVAEYHKSLLPHGTIVKLKAETENLGGILLGNQTFQKAGQYDPATKVITGHAEPGILAHEMGHAELDFAMERTKRALQDISMEAQADKSDIFEREHGLRADERIRSPRNEREQLRNDLMDFEWSVREEAAHPSDYSKAWLKESIIYDGPLSVEHPVGYEAGTPYGGRTSLRLTVMVKRSTNEAYAEFNRGYVLTDLKRRGIVDVISPQYEFKNMGTKESRASFLQLRKSIQATARA